jgi:hypothetical protein
MDSSVPCLNNVLGVKGVGELGTIGATPTWSTPWPMHWPEPAWRLKRLCCKCR